jgi:hypothetical protein
MKSSSTPPAEVTIQSTYKRDNKREENNKARTRECLTRNRIVSLIPEDIMFEV